MDFIIDKRLKKYVKEDRIEELKDIAMKVSKLIHIDYIEVKPVIEKGDIYIGEKMILNLNSDNYDLDSIYRDGFEDAIENLIYFSLNDIDRNLLPFFLIKIHSLDRLAEEKINDVIKTKEGTVKIGNKELSYEDIEPLWSKIKKNDELTIQWRREYLYYQLKKLYLS